MRHFDKNRQRTLTNANNKLGKQANRDTLQVKNNTESYKNILQGKCIPMSMSGWLKLTFAVIDCAINVTRIKDNIIHIQI